MTATATFRIVVGVDGSSDSRRALEWAITEAGLRNGAVHVVTAWQYSPLVVGYNDDQERDPDADQSKALRLQDNTLRAIPDQGVTVTTEVCQGHPAAVLLEASREADLLIVGSHGYGGLTGLLLGSVSNRVVHQARCPVLVVKPRHQGHL